MNQKRLGTNQGYRTIKWDNNGKGIIDKAAITAFEWGYCHCFAYAMNEETGWPIIGIGQNPVSPAHFVVYNPLIDDFVDIQGAGALSRKVERSYKSNAQFAEDGIEQFQPNVLPENYRPLDKAMAKPFVKTVLESIKDLPHKRTHKNWERWMREPFQA